jgi:YD repeat-containing protein
VSGESDLAGSLGGRCGAAHKNVSGRAWWLVTFTLLLFISSAIPGLAASPGGELASSQAGASPSLLPDETQFTEVTAQEESKEVEREEWLASPKAVNQREASEYAYSDLSASEEEELLRERFATQLEQLEADPARVLSHVDLDQVFSPTEAQVTVEGEKMLLESSIPLRAPEEKGNLRKVDLGLEETDRGYSPANPLVDLSLPETAAKPIFVGDSGLAISVEGARSDATARTFGKADLFLPDVDEDSSLLLSPRSGGVDISTLLLSRESPEQLSFAMTLPGNSTLRASESGGAEVLADDGSQLGHVNAPRAVDAQGAEVPVTLEVEGDALIIDVPHRSMDVAYPLLVDPEVIENWSGWSDPKTLGYWGWQWGGVAEKDYIGQASCIVTCWGSGLYVRSKSNFTYPAGSFGRWWFTAQGTTTYMRRVVVGPMNLDAHGCTANEPHAYTGVWNEGGWWSVLANAYPSGWGSYIDTGSGSLGEGTRTAFVGIGAASNSNIKCGRDYRLGGATLYLDDPEAPTITSVTGLPSGWAKGDTQIVASVTANDPGLGVQKIRAIGGPAGEWWWNQSTGCAGTMGDHCANTRSGQISFNTNGLWEGKGTISFQPYDPTGKASNSKSYEIWVDRLPPVIDLSGQLATATNEGGEKEVPAGEGDDLSLLTYNLKIEASDATSGAKSIEVFLDEKTSPEKTDAPECAAGKCSLLYQLRLTGLKSGPHVLRVIATDQAGNKTPEERKIEFEYTPATGIKDEYVMQYIPLPDGQDHSNEAESHGPEIAVNVVNGNVVYHERDLQVEGRDANLELERSYNSQLPLEKDTRWGHGWTAAQLPELESQPAESPPTKATMLRTSGAMTSSVGIPTSYSQPPTFDPKLHATIDKTAAGGYEVSYEDKEEENVFDSKGKLEETTYPSGAALKVDYKGEYKYVAPVYLSSFASYGTGNGQVDAPGDLTFDSKGNIWLLDQGNDRVEKLNSKGEFLTKFGSYGTGNGQLHMPSAIAIDEKGNLWVADTENSRIEEFGPDGKYLSQFGSKGAGNGQLGRPEGIAIDSKGNIWIADTYNSRIQEFSSSGTFIKSFGSFGTGKGQFYNPAGIDFGAGDTLWITDWSNNRVTELDESGNVLREFGSRGTGTGQFEHPDAVEADGTGRVWVGDEGNDRIEVFSESGTYITKFGVKGTAVGQFNLAFPMGVVSDGKGNLWISDAQNNRVQKWSVGEFLHGNEVTGMTIQESDPWTDTDISAEFATVKGLVDSVNVEGAAESDYSYELGRLTAEQDEEGETSYGYDSSNRLSLIELPNGTVASIEYDTLSRATAVTVDPAGSEGVKTTKFTYVDEPRETRVSGGGNPEVIYSIGNDGSVYRWSYAAEPPKFASVGGTLWEHRNNTTPLAAGDQSLSATAESAHQIAGVQVLINGEVVVEEKTCKDDPETTKHECQQVTLEWVTDTAAHPAGQLNIEVVATDFPGNAVAEKFFVTIPQQSAPESEVPVEPTFENVKNFREEFGLDYGSGRTQAEVNKLIFELLEEWKTEKPMALWSTGQWGVPMREPEIKELEYREQYIANAATTIPQWVEGHAASTYAGYYVDQHKGGIIYVGFTENQKLLVEQLKSEAGLTAPSQRVEPFPFQPVRSISELDVLQGAVAEATTTSSSPPQMFSVDLDIEHNGVKVGTSEVAQTTSFLSQALGQQSGLSAYYQASAASQLAGRYQTGHPFLAGEELRTENNRCTAGFGAWSRVGTGQNGIPIKHRYVLTAGHCGYATELNSGEVVLRSHSAADKKPVPIGTIERRAFFENPNRIDTDAEAVWLDDPTLVPGWVYECCGGRAAMRPTGVGYPKVGQVLCQSGQASNAVLCGPLQAEASLRRLEDTTTKRLSGWHWLLVIGSGGTGGDSGGPVWIRDTGAAVGLVAGGGPSVGLLVTPFERPPNAPAKQIGGILSDPYMSPNAHPLHVQLGP